MVNFDQCEGVAGTGSPLHYPCKLLAGKSGTPISSSSTTARYTNSCSSRTYVSTTGQNQVSWTVTLHDKSGNYTFSPNKNLISTGVSDPNGNSIYWGDNGNFPITYVDSLGQTVLTEGPYNGTSSWQFQWNSPQGTTAENSYLNESSQYFGTTFCGVQNEYRSFNAVTSLTFADGSSLGIGWETASGITNPKGGPYYTGRISSITLPSGGQITYNYSGGTGGINCTDGTPNTMTRTTPDGMWTYVHTVKLDSTTVKVHPDGTGALKKTVPSPSANRAADGPPRFIWLPRMLERP